MSYNGWSNWETWNVALWIDNEEDFYRAKLRYFAGHPCTAHFVERFVSEYLPDGTPDMDSPREMGAVDWDEIADNWAEEFKEDEEEEEEEITE